jgi:hypothetical protein
MNLYSYGKGEQMNLYPFKKGKVQSFVLLIVFFLPLVAAGADGDIISTNDNMDFRPDILLSDNSGGVINVEEWDGSGEIYAERYDNAGNRVWGSGIKVSDAYNAYDPAATEDMFGGVIVAYQSQNGIYAQRLNLNGLKLWNGGEGVLVLSGVTRFERPIITPDGAGGAYIGYRRRFNHITYLGEVEDPNGNEYISANSPRFAMVYDGQRVWDPRLGFWRPGGVFLAWYRETTPSPQTGNIYAQHVKNGAPQWVTDKVVAVAYPKFDNRDKRFYRVIRDNSGGVIVGWYHHPDSTFHVAAQRLDADGDRLWGDNGVTVLDSSIVGGGFTYWYNYLDLPELTTDGSGGAILAWEDYRNSDNYPGDSDIYCQRVDAAGDVCWKTGGIWVLFPGDYNGETPPNSGTENSPAMVSDGHGGAIIAAQDTGDSRNVYVDRIDADGVTVWSQWAVWDDGEVTPGDQESPTVVFDATGPDPKGVIVAWQGSADQYGAQAQKIEVSDTSPFDNDYSADVYTLSFPSPLRTIGSLYWATNEVDSTCDGDAGQPDVWYKFTAPDDGFFGVNTYGTNDLFGIDSGLDTVLSLYNITPHGVHTELICNDNVFRPQDCPDQGQIRDSKLSWVMNAGETVYVRVSRHGPTTNGMFKLEWGFTVQFFGDANSDGDADGSDLSDLAGEFGTACGQDCDTDFNGD